MNDDAVRTGFHCALVAGAVLLTWTETRIYDIDGPLAWLLAGVLSWLILFACSLVLFLLVPFWFSARESALRLVRGRL